MSGEGGEGTAAPAVPSSRSRAWASTAPGHVDADGVVRAHSGSEPRLEAVPPSGRVERERREDELLQHGATRAHGAGHRARAEEPDPERTCFERDRDRILHSAAFRRLAGKTQVFVFPEDHQRTRLTHALEVAQVATSVARAARLNVSLTEAIAIGHDCGHGPGGHASEEAFDAFLPGGYDHAVWGADVVLVPLNLCRETLDGVRNHSWSRPAPSTPEGVVVSWADRIAYCAHDLEDAVRAGIVSTSDLPDEVVRVAGRTRGEQLGTFIDALVECTSATGVIGMRGEVASALAALRTFNYERIYSRPEALEQTAAVVRVLRALVEFFVERPAELPADFQPGTLDVGGVSVAGVDPVVRAAVAYVGGMTDRYAFRAAARLLGWRSPALPDTGSPLA
ncbi:MAG TPA: HD domain-containing protein [Actinomycetales bacterium]|nr:HD domain-containing protein [Actinomycetales bacterium]